MTEKERIPWWKAFLPKKKTGGSKDTSANNFGPDFDPFAQRPDKQRDPSKTTGDLPPTQQEPIKPPVSDDTYDDSHLESVFNEQTCRRNMRVSRSGRFRERRKIRGTLPLQEKETENGAAEMEDKR